MLRDDDLRIVESLGMLPASQRTPSIVASLLSHDFVCKHPTLVRMLSSASRDKSLLKLCLDKIRHVRAGDGCVHDASVDIGNALADVYFPSR